MMDVNGKDDKNISSNPLTRIREMYTLAYTPEKVTKADEIMVKHFQHALAEIALAIAARKNSDQEVNP
jgi:hypothetical protein